MSFLHKDEVQKTFAIAEAAVYRLFPASAYKDSGTNCSHIICEAFIEWPSRFSRLRQASWDVILADLKIAEGEILKLRVCQAVCPCMDRLIQTVYL